MANRLLTAAKKKQAPVATATQRPFQNNENAGESGWMQPENQVQPPAKFGGPHRKMHAPGMRMRGKNGY